MSTLGSTPVDALLRQLPEAEWRVAETDATALARLARSDYGKALPTFVRELLVQRGFTTEADARAFLEPKLKSLGDPFDLPDMVRAVNRLTLAINEDHSVVIYGDYDVDGVTSMALMTRFLRRHEVKVRGFLPMRIEEGYGLSSAGVERMLTEGVPDLVIAVDCGTCSLQEVTALREAGADVIILDHHEPAEEGLPDAIVVNPKREAAADLRDLCSAGVVFKFLHAWQKATGNRDFDLRAHLDLVALATVADIVPLTRENRIFVKHGLTELAASEKPGVAALRTVAGVPEVINAGHIGFQMGPRINAAGRVDSAMSAYELLVTEDTARAKELAEELNERNLSRQQMERTIYEEALGVIVEEFDPERHGAIVLGAAGWHPGVVGIVSSRITRLFHRPSIVIAFDEEGLGKGSARSVEGVNLVEMIRECSDLLVSGGGHAMAAGLSIRRENFEAFRRLFLERMHSVPTEVFRPRLKIAAELPLRHVDVGLLDVMERLEPYGEGNGRPLFYSRLVYPERAPLVMKEKHTRLYFLQDGVAREAIWFNTVPSDMPEPPWDVAFSLERSIWRNVERLQIQVRAMRSTPGGDGLVLNPSA